MVVEFENLDYHHGRGGIELSRVRLVERVAIWLLYFHLPSLLQSSLSLRAYLPCKKSCI